MVREKTLIPNSIIEYTNTSRVIFVGPCILKVVNVAGDGANGDVQVYDGVNATGTIKAHMEVLTGTTFHLDTDGGVLFRQGVYIAVSANTVKVTIILIPVSQKDV